jgi:hypothetical protein
MSGYDAKYYAAARHIRDYFIAKGFTPEQACAPVANASAESSLNPKALGDHGIAFGLFQLHTDRCELIRDGGQGYKGCGIDLMTFPPIDKQLDAIWHELTHSEHHALAMIKAAKTAYDAGYAMSKYYERPGAVGQAERRGAGSQKWFEWFSTNSAQPDKAGT